MPLDSVNYCLNSVISCKALNLSELVMVSAGLIPWFPSCMDVVASHLTLLAPSHTAPALLQVTPSIQNYHKSSTGKERGS